MAVRVSPDPNACDGQAKFNACAFHSEYNLYTEPMDNLAQPESSMSTVRKSNRFLRVATAFVVLLIVAAAGRYTWYSMYRPCKVDAVERASTRLVTQLKWYDQAYQFAASSSPTALVRLVNTLQQILMDTQ